MAQGTPSASRVLFVDDEHLLLNVFERLFARHGIQADTCSSAEQAIEKMKRQPFDLVVTDFMMPEMDGLQLLAHIREHYPDTDVIMITAHANIQHAVRTMQTGAIDYLPKPFSTEELVNRVKARLEEKAAQAQAPKPVSSSTSRRTRRKRKKKVEYIGKHPAIQRLKEMLPRISRNKAPVFIRGESGTGKEILARLIHEMSDRAEGPYVTLNCANLPIELVESHLFGHRKGAFTGAIEDMTGAFERAHGGTLLLDEITEISLPVQAKLLRVLQEHEFQKVGSSEPQQVDVRIIATTNRDIGEAIRQGIFREDLYHRLAVFPLSVPPLRERISDIPLLVEHFIKKYCELYGLPRKTIAPELLRQFQMHSWPGNVRELENLVQRGVLLSAERTVIEPEDVLNNFFTDTGFGEGLASGTQAQKEGMPDFQTIEEMERYMILKTLKETNNNQQLAAQRLGISARTIRNKLRRYREQGLLNN